MLRPKSFTETPHGGWKLHNEFSNHTVGPYYAADQFVKNLKAHWNSNGIPTPLGWQHAMYDDACRQNGWDCIEDTEVHEDTLITQIGRQLWLELHAYAEEYPIQPKQKDKDAASVWMRNWISRIPRFSKCGCRSDFDRFEAAYPLDLSSREAFMKWAEVIHDRVNKKLNRPLKNEENRNHPIFLV